MRKDPKRLFRLRRPCKQEHDDVGVLGLTPCHHRGKSQVRQTDQVWYHHQLQVSSLAVDLQWCYCPLHYLRREKREEKRKRRKFYIYPDVTHTHTPGRAGETLKGKRKKKADTRRADGQKQCRGGRGTDGPPEPTYTAKRTWQKQSTHLNPTTHYGEASRRVIRDQWGLVGEKRKQQNCQTGLSS